MKTFAEVIVDNFTRIGDEAITFIVDCSGEVGKKTILSILEFVGQRNLDEIKRDTLYAKKTQIELLKSILFFQKDTEYGKKYNFAFINSIEEFCYIHPLTDYENYRSTIRHIANSGSYSQLVAEPVILLQETSGTTGEPKLIPRTNSLVASLQKAFLANFEITRQKFLNNKSYSECLGLAFFNSSSIHYTPGKIPKGFASSGGSKYKFLQKISSLYFCNPASSFLIHNVKSAYYCQWLFALIEPRIFYINANFASNILEALQILESNWQSLIEDIEYGRISENIKLESSIKNDLKCLLKPNKKLAKKLQKIFESGFEGILRKIWSDLAYVQCVTTGSMEIYKQKLKYYVEDVPIYSGNFASSEAWIGLNLEPDREVPAYTITPHSAFFEFIHSSEVKQHSPNTITLNSLLIEEIYEIVVTNAAGLYRYRTGDMVRCVKYYNETPVVEFMYRKGSLLNIAGEKVSERVIFDAIKNIIELKKTNGLLEYTTAIDINRMSYLIYIEMSIRNELEINVLSIANKIEEHICLSNNSYQKLRKNDVIKPLQVKIVEDNTFLLLKEKILLTNAQKSNPQFKMPRILKNKSYIDFIEKKVRQTSNNF